MEDILSSIKRIIAEENDATPSRAKRPERPERTVPRRTETDPSSRDEVLELREAVEPVPQAALSPPPAPVPPRLPIDLDTPSSPPTVAPPEPEKPKAAPDGILSQRTAAATRGPLDTLSRLVVKPEVPGSDTLESMVREMLRPMLREWLDANLPHMVEAMVAREIDRITGK